MTTSPVITPFPIFTDNDGTPLEGGYIYVGSEGLDPKTNPISVYTDIALTNPISQPIRTVNGYPVKGGAIVSLFVDGLYSITVEDVNQVFLYTSLDEGVVQGAIDTGTGDITTRGKIDIPIDGTALNAAGSINLGEGTAGVLDAGMYFDGVDLQIQTKGAAAQGINYDSETGVHAFHKASILTSTINEFGMDLISGLDYMINGVSLLNETDIGTSVVNSSLTSVGSLVDLNVDGPVTVGDQITAENQSQIKASVPAQVISSPTATQVINFNTASILKGNDIIQITDPAPFEEFKIVSAGVYLVTVTIAGDNNSTMTCTITHNRPFNVFFEESLSANSGARGALSKIIFANVNDGIQVKAGSNPNTTVVTALSSIEIIRLF